MKVYLLLLIVGIVFNSIAGESWINPNHVAIIHDGKTYYVPRPVGDKIRVFYCYGYSYSVYSDGTYEMTHYPYDGTGIPLFRN